MLEGKGVGTDASHTARERPHPALVTCFDPGNHGRLIFSFLFCKRENQFSGKLHIQMVELSPGLELSV